MKKLAWGAACGFAIALVACGGGGAAAPQTPDNAARLCARACAYREQCKHAGEEASCKAQCVQKPAAKRSDSLRPELVDGMLTCVEKTSCDDAGDAHEMTRRCMVEGGKSIQPNDKVVKACAALDDVTSRCGGSPPAGCKEKLKLLRDDLVDQFAECAGNPCKAAATCMRNFAANLRDD